MLNILTAPCFNMGKTKAVAICRQGVHAALAAIFCLPVMVMAQYTPPYVGLTGTLGSANGMPASNYIVTISPSQVMYVGGSSVVVANANCGTDTNGAIVGTPNPQSPAILSLSGSGTVPPGNYYVKVTWYDAFAHQTLPSPETQIQLIAAGSIVVSPPAGGAPRSAMGMDVYIGASSGAETYQGQTTNPSSTWTQSTPLATGAAPPIANSTVCMVVANDAAWPIGGYSLSITTPAGNTVPGYPQQVQFLGPGSAFDLSNGIPQWNGRVTYPVPVLTTPYNHNAQSISGPLSMTNYSVYNVFSLGVGTAVPAYGVDVEGSGSQSQINAAGGYLVNGAGGSIGQTDCLASINAGPYNTAVPCITSLPSLYYQTLQAGSTPLTQRPAASFSQYFALTDSAIPPQTNITLNVVSNGSESNVMTGTTPGVAGNCMKWDAAGGAADSGLPCGTVSVTQAAGLISSDGTSGSRQFYLTPNPDTTPPPSGYIYQNTSGTVRIVTVSADGGGGGFHGTVYCDSSSSPTTVVARFGRVNAGSANPNYYPAAVTFLVPAGYYYGISVTSGGNPPAVPVGSNALDSWTEYTLL